MRNHNVATLVPRQQGWASFGTINALRLSIQQLSSSTALMSSGSSASEASVREESVASVQLPKHQQGEPEQLLPGFDGDWDEGAEDDGEPTGSESESGSDSDDEMQDAAVESDEPPPDTSSQEDSVSEASSSEEGESEGEGESEEGREEAAAAAAAAGPFKRCTCRTCKNPKRRLRADGLLELSEFGVKTMCLHCNRRLSQQSRAKKALAN